MFVQDLTALKLFFVPRDPLFYIPRDYIFYITEFVNNLNMFSQRGRFNHHGKSLSSELKGEIIDSILEAGGDSTTGYFPGKWDNIGTKHKVYGKTVKDIWHRFVSTGDIHGEQKPRGNTSKLGQGELNLIEAMKTQNPSVSYKVIKENLLLHGNLPTGTSTTAISRAVRSSMLQGKMTWKRLSRAGNNKFTDENINYCQDFLDFMSQVEPYRLKFFDECGVALLDCNKHYGHSVVNTPCVEVGKYPHSQNITLNLLVGLEGILYADTIDGIDSIFSISLTKRVGIFREVATLC